MTDPAEPTADKGDESMPPDPFSPLFGVATEMFLVYSNFVQAGFTPEQAMQLTQAGLVTHMQINAVVALNRKREEGGDG